MQPTQLFFALVAVCATTAKAVPASAPVPGALEVRGFIYDFLPGPVASDVYSTVCKQEGNGKRGHCIDGTRTWLH